MRGQTIPHDAPARQGLPLHEQPDEELARRVRDEGYLPARDELFRRYHGWLRALIAQEVRRRRLPADDVEDIQQEAVLNFLHAPTAYRPRPGGRRFRTFATLVVLRRLGNGLRGRHRAERRRDGAVRADEWLAGLRALVAGRSQAPPADEDGDPARLAERHETAAAVRQALTGSDPLTRLVAERLAAGASLRGLAAELACSYDHVRQLITRLRRLLRSHGVPVPAFAPLP